MQSTLQVKILAETLAAMTASPEISHLSESRFSVITETNFVRVTLQMVFRFSLVPSVMGSHDGPTDLCPAPDVDTTSTFHGGLLWIDWAYSVFQSWSEHPSSC